MARGASDVGMAHVSGIGIFVGIALLVLRYLLSGRSVSSLDLRVRRSFWTLLIRYLVGWAVLLAATVVGGRAAVPFGLLLGLLVIFPGMWLTELCVRFGWVRVSYWCGRFSFPSGFNEELRVVGCYYGARALLKSSERSELEWIEAELGQAGRLGGAGIVALGICRWLRGDEERSAKLMELAEGLDAVFVSRHARRVARNFLVAQAAEQGDWESVIERGTARSPLRWSYFVARAAQRLAQAPRAPGRALLTLLFLLSPRRLATRPLLRRALDVDLRRVSTAGGTAPNDLGAALGELWSSLSGPNPDAFRLRRTLDNVRTQLASPFTHSEPDDPAPAIGSITRAEAAELFETQLIDMLTAWLDQRPGLRAELDPTGDNYLDAALGTVKEKYFQNLEVVAKEYKRRGQDSESLSARDEWLGWAELRALADKLERLDPTSRDELFQAVFIPLCNFAVHEQNIKKRKAFGSSVYAWLVGLATSSEDQELLTNNLQSTLK